MFESVMAPLTATRSVFNRIDPAYENALNSIYAELDEVTERALITIYQQHSGTRAANVALQRLIGSQSKFVISVCQKFCRQGETTEELLALAWVALETAVSEFDLTSNLRLFTFAKWKVVQAVQEESMCNRLLYTPRSVYRREMEDELLKNDPKAAKKLKIKNRKRHCGSQTMAHRSGGVVSIHMPVNETTGNRNVTMEEILPSGETPTDIDVLDRKAVSAALETIKGNDEMTRVVVARFGMDGQDAKSIQEIAEETNSSAHLVRKMLDEATRKMRRALSVEIDD